MATLTKTTNLIGIGLGILYPIRRNSESDENYNKRIQRLLEKHTIQQMEALLIDSELFPEINRRK